MHVKPKLRHFVWGSTLCIIACLLLSVILLGTSIYNFNSEKLYVSHPLVDDWIVLLKKLICLSSCLLLFSVLTFFAIHKKTKSGKLDIVIAVLVLFFTLALYVGSLILTCNAGDLVEKLPVSDDELFNSTKKAIQGGMQEHNDTNWVPVWLDDIQITKSCCGIRTFRDWNEFWVPQIRRVNKDFVPKSCCQKSREKQCVNDLSAIPFPDTIANNIKVESGCGTYVNQLLSRTFQDTYKFILLTMISIGVSLFAFGAQYAFVFFCRKDHQSKEPGYKNPLGNPAFNDEEQQPWELTDFFPHHRSMKGLTSMQSESEDAQLKQDGDSGTGMSGTTVTSIGYESVPSSGQYLATYSNSLVSKINDDDKLNIRQPQNVRFEEGFPTSRTRSISNALEKVEHDIEEMIGYEELSKGNYQDRLTTNRASLKPQDNTLEIVDQIPISGTNEIAEQTDFIPYDYDEYFPDDIGSPPLPKTSRTKPKDPSVVVKHHKHHRLQVKGISHSSSKHHRGHHHHGHHHQPKSNQEEEPQG